MMTEMSIKNFKVLLILKIEVLLLLLWFCFAPDYVSCANLNLFITEENLKRDLNLDFGSHIYLVSNGSKASLFSKPEAFRDLVAPLHDSIEKLHFHWAVSPSYGSVNYVLSTFSSDEVVMKRPNISISKEGKVDWYHHQDAGFEVSFPCSGKKAGIVDLGFLLNYASNGQNDSLKIVVRRQCFEKEIMPDSPSVATEKTWSKSLVIGLVTCFLLLCVIVGSCLAYWFIQKRNRKLQMKFDVDYELKMNNEEEEKRDDCVLELGEQDDLLTASMDNNSTKPIFTAQPKNPHHYHHKFKKSRKKRLEPRKSSTEYLASRSLEQIPEEDDTTESESNADSLSETDEEYSTFETTETLLSLYQRSASAMPVNDLSPDNLLQNITHKIQSDSMKNTNKKHMFRFKKELQINTDSLDNQAYQPSPVHTPTLPHTTETKIFNLDGEKLQQPPTDQCIDDLYSCLNSKWCSQFKEYLITEQQVIVDKHPLSRGAFGRIYRGRVKGLDKMHKSKMTSTSVKIMIPSTDFDSLNSFISDALLMTRFEHQNIMNLLGVVLKAHEAPWVIIPYTKYTDLNQYLRNTRASSRRSLSVKQLVNFGLQIADGMTYLASQGYVHRDLASRNCMLSEDFNIKISDFGLARDISKDHFRMNKKTRLPIKWMALESLTDYIFSEKTDVWSYGIVLWEIMVLGKQPYSGLENHQMEEYLTNGNRLKQPTNCPDEVFAVMSSCWLEEPSSRPCFLSILQNLTEFDARTKKYPSLIKTKINL